MPPESGRAESGGGVRGVPGRGFLDSPGEAFYPLYRELLADRRDFVRRVDTRLREALRDTPVELFLSRNLAIGTTLGLCLWVVGLALGYLGTVVWAGGVPPILGLSLPPELTAAAETARVLLVVLLSGLVLGAVGFAAGFGLPLVDLYYDAYRRERNIDQLLPDAIAYMYALSVGGMNHIEVIEAVADTEEVYGEVAREFQVIVQRTRYFDTDYRTAIRDRAAETPSEPLGRFFTDMLSIASSGSDMTQFFDEKAERHLEIARRRQEETLDTLELVGEMYLAVSLFPLLLIILLVVMSMVGEASPLLLYLTTYAIIPLVGLTFLVLISMIKRDELSEGFLTPPDGSEPTDERTLRFSLFRRPVTAGYRARHALFRRADRRELLHRLSYLLRNPWELFVTQPLATLVPTVPVAAGFVAYAFLSGLAPGSVSELFAEPVAGTVLYVYVPAFLTLVPLAVFHELYTRSRYGVLDDLSETLRKLSSTNDTGLTLLESFETVAETSPGVLSEEFDRIHRKVAYGKSLKTALVEFNNRYHVPRLARVVKLISEAQETSSRITEVLTTAARASENQDELARERRTRTRMQIAIILMTYLTLLGVMAVLKVQFLDVISGIVSAASGTEGSPVGVPLASGVGVDRLSLLFFHAVTVQAMVSGLIAGYLRDSDLLAGVKYVVALLIVTLAVWIVVA
jgi:flagellar protein FlaJ